jgi:hypothetical protein
MFTTASRPWKGRSAQFRAAPEGGVRGGSESGRHVALQKIYFGGVLSRFGPSAGL